MKKDKGGFLLWIRKTIQNFQLRLPEAKYHALIIAPAFQQGGVYWPQSRFVGSAGLQSLICLPINSRKEVFANIWLSRQNRNASNELSLKNI